MITYTHGNIFDFSGNVLVNTVNCVGVMGKGLAKAFRERYPEMFADYREACDRGDVQPGRLHLWHDAKHGHVIVNFPTKRHWRQRSRYEDIEAGLVALAEHLRNHPDWQIAIPPLGCGLGGLEWSKVRTMIHDHLADLPNQMSVYEPQPAM